MFGIRERNYNYDRISHPSGWPSYEEFLNLQSLDHITDFGIKQTLESRIEFDPIYHSSLRLKYPFNNCNILKQNYSQSWQDIFVLTVMNGKQQGTFVELGASEPQYMSNTYLLETEFGWSGVSIDFRENLKEEWQRLRPGGNLMLSNAWHTDFKLLLQAFDYQIDYLQVDLDESCSLACLKRIPTTHRFSAITFETDVFNNNEQIQKESRDYLKSLGYLLLIDNVAVKNYSTNTWEPFEDWYVDPTVIDKDIIDKLYCVDNQTKLPHEIFI